MTHRNSADLVMQLIAEVERLQRNVAAAERQLEETAHRRRLYAAEVLPGQRGDGQLREPTQNFTKGSPMKLFGRIQRQYRQGDHLVVEGTVDTDGEASASEWGAALKSTIPLREMHQNLAAGRITSATVLPGGRIFVQAVIVDPLAAQKTSAALYRGLSIAASRSSGVLRISEISLVDRPMQPNEKWLCRPAEELAKLYDDKDSKMASAEVDMTAAELIKRLGEAGLTIAPMASVASTPREREAALLDGQGRPSGPDELLGHARAGGSVRTRACPAAAVVLGCSALSSTGASPGSESHRCGRVF